MSRAKEVRVTLVGDDLLAVEATGLDAEAFVRGIVGKAVAELRSTDEPVTEEPTPEPEPVTRGRRGGL
jgi:hypothetical protein